MLQYLAPPADIGRTGGKGTWRENNLAEILLLCRGVEVKGKLRAYGEWEDKKSETSPQPCMAAPASSTHLGV